jgi:hypothetical protein
MKTRLLALGPIALSLAAYACSSVGSSTTSNDGGSDGDVSSDASSSNDAGVTASDAATLLDAVAAASDGAASDATADASAPIVVHVGDQDANPGANIDVFFVDGAGNVTSAKTGMDGRATYAASSPTTVWVVQFVYGDAYTTTSVDVSPGDTVEVEQVLGGNSPPANMLGQAYGLIAPYPPANPDGGTPEFAIAQDLPCDLMDPAAVGGEYTLHPNVSCLDPAGKYTFLVGALDSTSHEAIAFAPKSSAVVGTIGTRADVLASDWIPVTKQQVDITGTVPSVYSKAAGIEVWFIRDNRAYGAASYSLTTTPTSIQYVPLPSSFMPEVLMDTGLIGAGNGSTTWSVFDLARRPNATGVVVDLSTMIPRIHDPVISGTTVAPHVAWQEDAPRAHDGIVEVSLQSFLQSDAGGGPYMTSWVVSAPLAKAATSIDYVIPPQVVALMGAASPWKFEALQVTSSSVSVAPYGRTHPMRALYDHVSFAALLPAGTPHVYVQLLTQGV